MKFLNEQALPKFGAECDGSRDYFLITCLEQQKENRNQVKQTDQISLNCHSLITHEKGGRKWVGGGGGWCHRMWAWE